MRLCVLLLLAVCGASVVLFVFSGSPNGPSLPDESFSDHGTRSLRILEEKRQYEYIPHTGRKKTAAGDLNLEDYRPIDPSPATKASIKHGPIEHGTPLNPYIIAMPPPPPPPPRPSRPKN